MNMPEKVLYKAVVKIQRAMSPFDRYHKYVADQTIYLDTGRDCGLQEIYERLGNREQEIKRLMVSRFSHILGPFRVSGKITCEGEKESHTGLIVEDYIFCI